MSRSSSNRSRSPYLRALRTAVSACVAGWAAVAVASCGSDDREPVDAAASTQSASADPAEEQRRIAAIAPPPAGELRFGESGDTRKLARRVPSSGVVYLLGGPLVEQIAYAYGVPPAEVVDTMSLELQRRYDAVVHPADDSVETARGMLRGHLESRFGFEADVVLREVETMILRQMKRFSPLPPSTAQTSSFEARPGELRAVGVPISRLVEFLQQSSKMPVVDETGLDQRYDFVIQWDTRSGAYAFLQAVNDLGLEIIRQPRSVELLELRPASGSAASAGAGASGSGGGEEQAHVR